MTTRPDPIPEAELDPVKVLADIIHEARCGPVMWRGDEHVPWTDNHREWDVATAKAMLLLGVTLAAARQPELAREVALREARTEMYGLISARVMSGAPGDWMGFEDAINAAFDRLLSASTEPSAEP